MGAQVAREKRRESADARMAPQPSAGSVFSFAMESLKSPGTIERSAPFVIGVCAMDKKATSQPMTEILQRLPKNSFQIVLFGDDMILNRSVEEWPLCDALIAFFSTGFPLDKAMEYVELRQPIVVNDLSNQNLLMDRRDVYRILEEHNIPTPKHIVVNRDGYRGSDPNPDFIECEDYVELNGVRINKPFVEKPVNGEDHNIYIYYPTNAGGGCKHLFRKIGNRSSEFHPHENSVRRSDGQSYIYEEFIATQGTDVKVYTVGPNYAHAEARKSPVLDGKVMRDSLGKEIRYPVILSTNEKDIAHKVCRAFGQTVCGFDILRVGNESYVCDVNGWSFVKNSPKYYDDCSVLLRQYLERALAGYDDPYADMHSPPLDRERSMTNSSSMSLLHADGTASEGECDAFDHIESGNVSDEEEELRCVLAVIRHGDRTPKQKMKMLVTLPRLLEFYEARVGRGKKKDLKIKTIKDLEELLAVSKELIAEYEAKHRQRLENPNAIEDDIAEDIDAEQLKGIYTLRDVLQRWQLCGINRKVQMKPRAWTDEDLSGPATPVPIERQARLESLTNLNASPKASDKDRCGRISQLLLIVKWGGDLTHSGIQQAETLGQHFRQIMYPGGDGGLLRLHSTYRHDLKIYTSDEGRVQKTAASFAKGLLELDGDIIPILVSLVLKSKDADSMLDQSGSSAQEMIMAVKERLHDILHRDDDCGLLRTNSNSRLVRSVAAALDVVEQPMKKMERMHKLLGHLKDQLTVLLDAEATEKAERVLTATEFERGLMDDSEVRELERQGSETTVASCLELEAQAPEPFSPTSKAPKSRKGSFSEVKAKSQAATPSPMSPKGRPMTPTASSLNSLATSPRRLGPGGRSTKREPCGRETLDMMRERWAKLYRDFYSKKGKTFDLSKIPDIHDCIRYDAMHNAHLYLNGIKELLDISASLAHALVPQEYGIDVHEKLHIGTNMCHSLLKKMRDDLDLARGFNITHRLDPSYATKDIKSKNRSVRTRLYFTSESHLHTLLNVLRHSVTRKEEDCPISVAGRKWVEEIPELCYMTHIVVRVFERCGLDSLDPRRFRVEVSLSPGATGNPLEDFSPKKPLPVAPLHVISKDSLTCQAFQDYICKAIAFKETSE
ncbi:inositol hexakisphosphate and diphosphoinositol-pentakisphosphate kinase [Achlya hypogyna]|uniref:Inositol hexakisphosphate and diphosphoinositol-pentakisphosphate kinase n=1 Tax=Achlya hypogyna TaxID=1202772 RepID=A0A1V9ZSC9_ACHHY|nr:inositol hexakisphosphate and diphosphoinositol-pentakisphosphate kinase [Achlya hypogyna]